MGTCSAHKAASRALGVLRAESISQNRVQGRIHPHESSSPWMPPTPREDPGVALFLLEGGFAKRNGVQARDYRGRKAHKRQDLKSFALVLVFPTSKGFIGWGQWVSRAAANTTQGEQRCNQAHSPAICTLGQTGKCTSESEDLIVRARKNERPVFPTPICL